MWVVTRVQVMLQVLYSFTSLPLVSWYNCGGIITILVSMLLMPRHVWRFHSFPVLNITFIPVPWFSMEEKHKLLSSFMSINLLIWIHIRTQLNSDSYKYHENFLVMIKTCYKHSNKQMLMQLYWFTYFEIVVLIADRLCGLVVRVLGYRSGGPGSIPGTTRKKGSGSGTESTQPREYNWGATW
jgi:hypothetical protein